MPKKKTAKASAKPAASGPTGRQVILGDVPENNNNGADNSTSETILPTTTTRTRSSRARTVKLEIEADPTPPKQTKAPARRVSKRTVEKQPIIEQEPEEQDQQDSTQSQSQPQPPPQRQQRGGRNKKNNKRNQRAMSQEEGESGASQQQGDEGASVNMEESGQITELEQSAPLDSVQEDQPNNKRRRIVVATSVDTTNIPLPPLSAPVSSAGTRIVGRASANSALPSANSAIPSSLPPASASSNAPRQGSAPPAIATKTEPKDVDMKSPTRSPERVKPEQSPTRSPKRESTVTTVAAPDTATTTTSQALKSPVKEESEREKGREPERESERDNRNQDQYDSKPRPDSRDSSRYESHRGRDFERGRDRDRDHNRAHGREFERGRGRDDRDRQYTTHNNKLDNNYTTTSNNHYRTMDSYRPGDDDRRGRGRSHPNIVIIEKPEYRNVKLERRDGARGSADNGRRDTIRGRSHSRSRRRSRSPGNHDRASNHSTSQDRQRRRAPLPDQSAVFEKEHHQSRNNSNEFRNSAEFRNNSNEFRNSTEAPFRRDHYSPQEVARKRKPSVDETGEQGVKRIRSVESLPSSNSRSWVPPGRPVGKDNHQPRGRPWAYYEEVVDRIISDKNSDFKALVGVLERIYEEDYDPNWPMLSRMYKEALLRKNSSVLNATFDAIHRRKMMMGATRIFAGDVELYYSAIEFAIEKVEVELLKKCWEYVKDVGITFYAERGEALASFVVSKNNPVLVSKFYHGWLLAKQALSIPLLEILLESFIESKSFPNATHLLNVAIRENLVPGVDLIQRLYHETKTQPSCSSVDATFVAKFMKERNIPFEKQIVPTESKRQSNTDLPNEMLEVLRNKAELSDADKRQCDILLETARTDDALALFDSIASKGHLPSPKPLMTLLKSSNADKISLAKFIGAINKLLINEQGQIFHTVESSFILALIDACLHNGLVDHGLWYFRYLKSLNTPRDFMTYKPFFDAMMAGVPIPTAFDIYTDCKKDGIKLQDIEYRGFFLCLHHANDFENAYNVFRDAQVHRVVFEPTDDAKIMSVLVSSNHLREAASFFATRDLTTKVGVVFGSRSNSFVEYAKKLIDAGLYRDLEALLFAAKKGRYKVTKVMFESIMDHLITLNVPEARATMVKIYMYGFWFRVIGSFHAEEILIGKIHVEDASNLFQAKIDIVRHFEYLKALIPKLSTSASSSSLQSTSNSSSSSSSSPDRMAFAKLQIICPKRILLPGGQRLNDSKAIADSILDIISSDLPSGLSPNMHITKDERTGFAVIEIPKEVLVDWLMSRFKNSLSCLPEVPENLTENGSLRFAKQEMFESPMFNGGMI